jgi:hypothetical protein
VSVLVNFLYTSLTKGANKLKVFVPGKHFQPESNVIKLFFLRYYLAVGITSVKIIEKYAASYVNCTEKSFITFEGKRGLPERGCST